MTFNDKLDLLITAMVAVKPEFGEVVSQTTAEAFLKRIDWAKVSAEPPTEVRRKMVTKQVMALCEELANHDRFVTEPPPEVPLPDNLPRYEDLKQTFAYDGIEVTVRAHNLDVRDRSVALEYVTEAGFTEPYPVTNLPLDVLKDIVKFATETPTSIQTQFGLQGVKLTTVQTGRFQSAKPNTVSVPRERRPSDDDVFADAVSGLTEFYPEVLANAELVGEIRKRVTATDRTASDQDRYQAMRDAVERLCTEFITDRRFVTPPTERTRPLDLYPPNTVFICQQCHKNYAYGEAEAAATEQDFNTLAFCSHACQRRYLLKHGHMPRVGAEIPLGNWEECNLRFVGTDAGEKILAALLERIRTGNIKPTVIIQDEIVYDVPKADLEAIIKEAKAEPQ